MLGRRACQVRLEALFSVPGSGRNGRDRGIILRGAGPRADAADKADHVHSGAAFAGAKRRSCINS